MRFFALCICSAMALASSATAQTTSFATLASTDWTVRARTPASFDVENRQFDTYEFVPTGTVIATFTPFMRSYPSNRFLEQIEDVRRYGGRVTIPLSRTGLLLEGEGARDYGPNSKKLDLGRLRLTKPITAVWSGGFEAGLYRGNPPELHGAPHEDKEWVFGVHLTRKLGAQ